MKSDYEVELTDGVCEDYWLIQRGFTRFEYKQVRRNCTAGNFGFCESCMGKIHCEDVVKRRYV